MNQVICNKIFEAVKCDDLVTFSKLIENNENLCFGRFPLFSVCILFSAKKIIKKYKQKFNNLEKFNIVSENFEIYKRFKNYAGKALRIYINEKTIVSPIEMLAIMGQNIQVKKMFKKLTVTEQIVNNLKKIYFINNQSIEVNRTSLKIGWKPLSQYQIRNYKLGIILSLLLIFTSSILYLSFYFTLGIGTSWSYFKVNNKDQFVSALKSNSSIILTDNIIINESLYVTKFNGNIDGNGYTIYLNSQYEQEIIKENSGIIKNLKIVYNTIEDEIEESLSLLVVNNYGTIENVDISCDSLSLVCNKSEERDIYVSGFAKENYGTINNSSITVKASIMTSSEGECFFGGLVGNNFGKIMNSKINDGSIISTSSADASGIVVINEGSGIIEFCNNYALILQTSEISDWSPNVSGIALTNYGEINNSKNLATLKIESTYDDSENKGTIFMGGISCMNYGNISKCLNKANLEINSKYLSIYCGGITAYSTYLTNNSPLPVISGCGVQGEINVNIENETTFIFVGGISGYMYGEINKSYSMASFMTANDETRHFVGTYLGGSYLQYQVFGDNILCFLASDNIALAQDNVNYHIGCLINNNTIVNAGIDQVESRIKTLITEEEIKNEGVYWDEL